MFELHEHVSKIELSRPTRHALNTHTIVQIHTHKMPARSLKTTDVKMPARKTDGGKDARYSGPQFCKSNGQRDMRTTLMRARK